jgi:amino acid transporter
MVLGLSAVPALVFGVWVTPQAWRSVLWSVLLAASVLGRRARAGPVAAGRRPVPPLALLTHLNNLGLKQSVRVSRGRHAASTSRIMAVTIVGGWLCLALQGVDLTPCSTAPAPRSAGDPGASGTTAASCPGLALIGAPLLLAGVGNVILGASGVESVMNIPEELENPSATCPRSTGRCCSSCWSSAARSRCWCSCCCRRGAARPLERPPRASSAATSGFGLTGSLIVGDTWRTVMLANAALMLIAATNTAFVGARGLWLAMARDDLLPRMLLVSNERGRSRGCTG